MNEFLKPEETETTKGNEMKNNDTWIKVAKNRERWKGMESAYAKTAAVITVAQCAAQREPSARSDPTSTLPERREVGR